MRPTVTEQLSGMAAILRERVLPTVEEPLAASQLESVADAMDRLSTSWGEVVTDLVAENRAIEAFISDVGAELHLATDQRLIEIADASHALRVVIEPSGSEPDLSFEALRARNNELREFLEKLAKVLRNEPDLGGQSTHLQDRMLMLLRGAVDRRLGQTGEP